MQHISAPWWDKRCIEAVLFLPITMFGLIVPEPEVHDAATFTLRNEVCETADEERETA